MSSAAWESLHKATLELAKPSALKQRLTDAYTRFLMDMPAAEMPRELRPDFESLCGQMTRVRPLMGETAVVATVRKMSMEEADACAARIVALLDALHRHATNGHGKANGQTATRALVAIDTAAAARVPTLISINRA